MPLLPGGAGGRVPRAVQLAIGVGVISFGWQGFENLYRYSALQQNLDALIEEVDIEGEASFRAKLVQILEVNSVPIDAADIHVLRDASGAVLVQVPCQFRISLFGWHRDFTKVIEARAARSGFAAIER